MEAIHNGDSILCRPERARSRCLTQQVIQAHCLAVRHADMVPMPTTKWILPKLLIDYIVTQIYAYVADEDAGRCCISRSPLDDLPDVRVATETALRRRCPRLLHTAIMTEGRLDVRCRRSSRRLRAGTLPRLERPVTARRGRTVSSAVERDRWRRSWATSRWSSPPTTAAVPRREASLRSETRCRLRPPFQAGISSARCGLGSAASRRVGSCRGAAGPGSSCPRPHPGHKGHPCVSSPPALASGTRGRLQRSLATGRPSGLHAPCPPTPPASLAPSPAGAAACARYCALATCRYRALSAVQGQRLTSRASVPGGLRPGAFGRRPGAARNQL
jgi:hypothetical protein